MDSKIYKPTLQLIKIINNEIRDSKIYNIEYLLLSVSSVLSKDVSISKDKITKITLDEVRKILLHKSETYKAMYSNEKYANILVYFEIYMKKLLTKYNEMMMQGQEKFDSYVHLAKGNQLKKKIYDRENIAMELSDIQNTISLLSEAITLYLNLYEKRTIRIFFNNEENMDFKIKESELAHILGIELKRITQNPKLIDLFKITPKEIEDFNKHTGDGALQILLKLIDIDSGNLLQYEEERLKKLLQKNYFYTLGEPIVVNYSRFDENGVVRKDYSIDYYKVNVRSKLFMNFKPLEELSLAISLPKGTKILKKYYQDKIPTHTVLVSQNKLSEKYTYSSLVANVDEEDNYRKYFQTLLANNSEEYNNWKETKEAKVSIAKKVFIEGDEGSGRRSYESFFTPEQQYEFIKEVYEDFANYDIENVIEYFKDLGYEIRGKRL